MKKTIALLLLALFASSYSGFAQKQKLNLDVSTLYFYGIDFSEVRIAGAYENNDYFVRAFIGINGLFVSEPAKYDFSPLVKCDVETDITAMTQRTREMDRSRMRRDGISDARVEDLVSAYSLPHDEGAGMVLIARLLDKDAGTGTFDIVFFDIATRDILYVKRVTKRAGGAGLRNYWAHTVYEMVRDRRLFS